MSLEQLSISLIITAIVILCFMKKITLKINVRWITIVMFLTVAVLLIAGSSLFIRQHFIPFSSPENAYKHVYGGKTYIVVEGVESDFVIGDKDAKYINKSKKGWTVPIINISITKGMKRINSTTIYVTQHNFSDEYYLTILDSENNSLDIQDNRNSTFYKFNNTNKESNIQSCIYYTYVNKINSDYSITVNGETLKVFE